MKFNEIEVFINSHNEIAIKQGNEEFDKHFRIVFITKDQADIVADEIKRLAKQLKKEGAKE
jgi:hypothetical protein